ncbi:hypothetical protein [Rhizobium leguminosarum]|uniref:hypothetical protein n=1 Tax=Rhizobium leguminosarum TaxID=384 RepID=UPI001C94B321|nr:hypothetical protein [Rhizobium leguminosarum]MBY5415363.1 hypothetical protein [Rhizobium leguminosarum]
MAEGTALTELDMLCGVIAHLFPERSRTVPGRQVNIGVTHGPGADDLEAATSALKDEAANSYVDAEVVLKLLNAIEALRWTGIAADTLRTRVTAHVERRWPYFVETLIRCAFETHQPSSVFGAFPKLRCERLFFTRLATSIATRQDYAFRLEWLLDELAPKTLAEVRVLVAALLERGNSDSREYLTLATSLFCSLGRGMGWTPWISLQAILHVRPDYADLHTTFEREGDRSKESQATFDRRLEMAGAIEAQTNVRDVAGLVLELVGQGAGWRDHGLLSRPAETRAAFVDSLRATIGGNPQLRQAVIEALLWSGDGRAADLAQFAAVALAQPEDRSALLELERHPVRLVQYAARAIRATKFGEQLGVGALPAGGSLLQALVTLDGGVASTDEPARTWLGDRAVERLIEQTIARVEAKFAQEYTNHGDEGEDRLLSSLFRELALRFADLDQALEALARAAAAPHRASVAMEYRNVDRAEEGAKGIRKVKSFSADLCLIVDPMIDGASLGRRVTLVQAKRLYRNKRARKQPAWSDSFKIDRDQRLHLQEQTHASVYFFHGPPAGGRGVPVIPTQLVADLSEHKGSGTTLSRDVVAVASRSLADWLTYDALALRVGDPYAELVNRAGGAPGSLPRPLLGVPTIEIQVALRPRSELR